MKKAVDISKEINEMRKIPGNKKCAECGEIGTTYIVPDFGVFVCSICAGIHREFSHRVKGLSMSNFSLQELETLKRQGNEVCQRTWLARYNPRDFPQPSPKETQRIKDFIRLKYKERRWYQDQPQDSVVAVQAEIAAAPVSTPSIPLQVASPPSVGDLLSMGEPGKPADSWAEFSPATNQVNIQISFQQPSKPEEKKQQPDPNNPVQVQFTRSFPDPQKKETAAFPQQQLPEKPPVSVAVPPVPQTNSYPSVVSYPQTRDPFSGMMEGDIGKQYAQQGNLRNLQQMYYVIAQIYGQLYGAQYPYSFQAWLPVAFPKPAVAPQPQTAIPQVSRAPMEAPKSRGSSNNPFDTFSS